MDLHGMMTTYPPSIAAAKKLSGLAPDFAFYAWEWLGDKPDEWTTMKVVGAVLREAKSGPNKGKKCIIVKGTERTTYVTDDEVQAAAKEVEHA